MSKHTKGRFRPKKVSASAFPRNGLNKKGIALDIAVSLIAGVVFLVVVVYILIATGLLASFTERTLVTVCTASALSRGVIVNVIWSILKNIILLITIIELIVGIGSLGMGTAGVIQAKAAGYFIKEATKNLLKGIAGSVGMFSFATILTYTMIGVIFPKIPIACATITLDVGYSGKDLQAQPGEFYTMAGSRTMDCWDMLGQGKWDTLWGVDGGNGPNPRSCFIIDAHLQKKSDGNYPTLKDLYKNTSESFKKNWELGLTKLYVYCNGKNMGNNFDSWGDCKIDDKRLHIMYFDKHEYDLISYGTAACNIDNAPAGEDVIVWCVEDL